MEDKARFISLCETIKRDGFSDLLAWLEDTDFYFCPASSKYHGAYPGGLLKHSLDVYDELKRLLDAYPEIGENISEESATLVSLFHDLCKANYYATEKRNRKDENGRWESYDYYTVKEKFCFGSHGGKSVFLLHHFVKLTPEEAVAINCHMGAYSENPGDISKAYEAFPLAWLLHVADESATYLKEKENT